LDLAGTAGEGVVGDGGGGDGAFGEVAGFLELAEFFPTFRHPDLTGKRMT